MLNGPHDSMAGNAETRGLGMRGQRESAGGLPPGGGHVPGPGQALAAAGSISVLRARRTAVSVARGLARRHSLRGPSPTARDRLEPLEIHAQQPAAPGGVSARTTSSRSPGVQQGIFGGLPAAEGTQKPPEPSVRVARSPLGPSGSSQRPHPRIRKQQAQRAPSSHLIFEPWGEQWPVLTYWEPPFETNSVTARKRPLS